MSEEICPICSQKLKAFKQLADVMDCDCGNCGRFQMTSLARSCIEEPFSRIEDARLKMSHYIREVQRGNSLPKIDETMIRAILERPLPRPSEQADLLIRWLGDNSKEAGQRHKISMESHGAVLGVRSFDGIVAVVDHLIDQGLVSGRPRPDPFSVELGMRMTLDSPIHVSKIALTVKGWERYEEIKRGCPILC